MLKTYISNKNNLLNFSFKVLKIKFYSSDYILHQ